MDNKKLGLLLKAMRIEKNYTQDELADKLCVCRQAISRWETGKSIPDYEQLLSLSKLYNISIDEILYGQKVSNSFITKHLFKLLKETNKYKKTRNTLIIICICCFLSLTIYFFITTFNKVNIYEISGSSSDINCAKSLLVQTTDEVYFKTCDFVIINPTLDTSDIETVTYYYYEQKNKVLIQEGGKELSLLKESNIGSELLDFSKINSILNNFYVDVTIKNKVYIIKLDYKIAFTNSNIVNPIDNRKMEKVNLHSFV